MTVGIERHFLLKHDGWYNQASAPQTLYQDCISVGKERTIRVRTIGDRAWLMLKGYVSDLSHSELEYEISLKHARQMMDGIRPFKMEKRHYRVPYGGFVFEINEYGGNNTPLIMAEIELPSEDTRFERPNQLGEEITSDGRFTSAYLSKRPYSAWKK